MKSLGETMAQSAVVGRVAGEARRRPFADQAPSEGDGFQSKHGWISGDELRGQGAVKMTTHAGERAWVWPLYWMDGEPVYPPVHLPPGEERRRVEAGLMHTYEEYRKAKRPHVRRGGYERG